LKRARGIERELRLKSKQLVLVGEKWGWRAITIKGFNDDKNPPNVVE
jgi:hypothetical protein